MPDKMTVYSPPTVKGLKTSCRYKAVKENKLSLKLNYFIRSHVNLREKT